jgi:hypothetical protein
MKKLLIIPAFLLAFSPVFGNSVIEGQAKACISENGSDQAGLISKRAGTATSPPVQVYFDKEVNVSPSNTP